MSKCTLCGVGAKPTATEMALESKGLIVLPGFKDLKQADHRDTLREYIPDYGEFDVAMEQRCDPLTVDKDAKVRCSVPLALLTDQYNTVIYIDNKDRKPLSFEIDGVRTILNIGNIFNPLSAEELKQTRELIDQTSKW